MRKQKQSSHPKAEAARARKEDQRSASQLAEEAARADAFWRDEDKLSQRKLQRRTDRESRRLEEVDRRADLRKLEADEIEQIDLESRSKSRSNAPAPPKITQAQIQTKIHSSAPIYKPPVAIVTELPLQENVNHTSNRLDPFKGDARSVEEAIQLLHAPSDSNERRLQAAFSKYQGDRLPQLQEANPTLRLSQVKQLLKKEWKRSQDNPANHFGALK